MAFWKGSAADLQSRRAISALDGGQLRGPLVILLGKDTLPPGDVHYPAFGVLPKQEFDGRVAQNQTARLASDSGAIGTPYPRLLGKDTLPPGDVHANNPFNPPNAAQALAKTQTQIALNANSVAQVDTPLPSFVGLDKFYDGQGKSPNFDYPNPSFAVVGRQAFVARLSADAGNWNGPLPLLGAVVAAPTSLSDWPNPSFTVPLAQNRVARTATDLGQQDGPLDCLFGQDAFPNGAGGANTFDWPDPSFAVVAAAATRAARQASDLGQINTPLPILFGQDQLAVGEQSQDLPAKAPARARDYSFTASYFQGLIGADAMATGEQSQDLPPRAALRARDYTYAYTPYPLLFAQDALAPGEQLSGNAPATARRASTLGEPGVNFTIPLSGALPVGQTTLATELAPRAALRERDYSFTADYFAGLIGQDAFNPGEQLSGNAPAGAARASTLASDPGVNLTIVLAAVTPPIPPGVAALDQQYRTTPRAREYGQAAGFFHGLDGQDALAVGDQLSGNAPAGARRAIDYGWFQAFPLELIAQDALVTGAQLSGNAPLGASRSRDYTWLQSLSLETIGPRQQFPVGQAAYDLPTPAVLRARDYSFSASYFQGLIGQDALPTGDQLSGNTPATAPRASTLSEPGVNQTILLTAAPPVIPYGLSTALTALAPTGPLRAREYGQTSAFFHGLDGKDALPVGDSTAATELTPKATPRARDYSFTAAFFHGLDGKDVLPNGIGGQVQHDWPLPTPAPRRSFAIYEPGVNNTVQAPAVPPPHHATAPAAVAVLAIRARSSGVVTRARW